MSAEPRSYGGRFALRGVTLRRLAARGTIVNSVFLVAVALLGLVRGFVLARFVSAEEYGVWGVLLISLGTLLWLKQAGIGDKYIQQDDRDQERAFQRAFTLELLFTSAFLVVMLAALPVVALVYGRSDLIAPGLLLLTVLPALALQAPLWVFYRRMEFARQRLLQAVEPLVGFVVGVGLAVAGAGTWALVGGVVAGVWAGALVAVVASPYRLRLRYDAGTARSYVSFSWPLLVASASGIAIAQSAILASNDAAGIAAAGAVTLAATISQFADRVDQVITGTLYPAICAVADRVDTLHESFVKSNRLALMWALPFGVGLALFGPDLVADALGHGWDRATILIQAFGLTAAAGHLGFNWDAYVRARGQTRPLAVAAAVTCVAFLAGLPLVWVRGLDGLAVAMGLSTVAALCVRGVYLRRLFSGFALGRHAARALAPVVPGAAVVLLVRAAEHGQRTAEVAAGELAAYVAVVAVATWMLERDLLREAVGYLRAG